MSTTHKPSLISFYRLYVKFLDTRDFYDLPASVELDKCLHRVKKDRELLKHLSPHGRFIVNPKDIEIIYDEVFYSSRDVLQEIRDKCNLPAGAPVLITDFCEYAGKDFPTVYKLMNKNHPKDQEVPTHLPTAWMKYYETRDWYHLPDSIDAGNSLNTEPGSNLKKTKRDPSPQLIVYPKHIEVYFEKTPEAAFAFLQDIRKSRALSIGIPVVLGDVNEHRKCADNKLLFFIMDS
jgi:hypothetical protein